MLHYTCILWTLLAHKIALNQDMREKIILWNVTSISKYGNKQVNLHLKPIKGKRQVNLHLESIKGKRQVNLHLESIKGNKQVKVHLKPIKGKRQVNLHLNANLNLIVIMSATVQFYSSFFFLLSTTASSIEVFFLTGNCPYLLQTLYVPCLLVSSQLVLAGFLNGWLLLYIEHSHTFQFNWSHNIQSFSKLFHWTLTLSLTLSYSYAQDHFQD